MRCLFLLIAVASAVLLSAPAFGSNAPVLFYSDLPGGMCTGGQDNKGHIVTVRGRNFGAGQDATHYLTLAGITADTYVLWQDDKIAFQTHCSLAANKDYEISVTTPGGKSNALLFHIYTGAKIYFMSTAKGSDSNDGSFAHPFATNFRCFNMAAAAPGNTCYMMPGSWDKSGPGPGTASWIYANYVFGSVDKYIGVVGYPTADVQQYPRIGCDDKNSGCSTSATGIRIWNSSYLVFANLRVYGSSAYYGAVEIGSQSELVDRPHTAHHIRTIDLDITAPQLGFGLAYVTGEASFLTSYGVRFHDISSQPISSGFSSRGSGEYYIGDSSHDVDIGWNTLDNSCIYSWGCHTNKPFEIHSTGKLYQPMSPPKIQGGSGTKNGDVYASGGGSLRAGIYDVVVTYRSRLYYGGPLEFRRWQQDNSGCFSTHTCNSLETETDGTSAVVSVALSGDTGSDAIRIHWPTGADHLRYLTDPREIDDVSTLCNPSLAYKVYACLRDNAATPCVPVYQGETSYSTPTGPNTITSADHVLTVIASGHSYITPQGDLNAPLAPGQAYRAVQAGCNIYNLKLHDSTISFAPGYSLTWAQLGLDKGYVQVYNNEISNSGNNWNWNTASGDSVPVCVNLPGTSDDGHEYSAGGNIEFYNNTFYNCGKYPKSYGVAGVLSTYWSPLLPTRRLIFLNNIFDQPVKGQTWLADSLVPFPSSLQIVGSNNLCWSFGEGALCSNFPFNPQGGGVTADPLFTSAGTATSDPAGVGGTIYVGANLQPRSGSPAIDAGTDTSKIVNYDIRGIRRPQGRAVDIGNCEFQP